MAGTNRGAFALAGFLVACGGPDGEPPGFPADYTTSFTEVRNCRRSIDHDQNNVRVVASPDAREAYQGRAIPFPTGAIVLKEQYGPADTTCAGDIVDYTVMIRLATGSAPATLDWTWQHVSADREILPDDIMKCTRCHADCAAQSVGYMGTCEEP